jgi:Sulfotransferase domain
LLCDGVRQLGRIANFLGLPANDSALATAVERNRFEKLREKEAQNPQHPEEYFFRKGRSGTGREELSADTQRTIAAEAQPIYDRARAAITPA